MEQGIRRFWRLYVSLLAVIRRFFGAVLGRCGA
jgi:hypothetical protein